MRTGLENVLSMPWGREELGFSRVGCAPAVAYQAELEWFKSISVLSLGYKPCPEPGLALRSSLEAHGSQQMEGAGWASGSQSTGLLLLQHFQLENKSEGKAVPESVGGFGLQVSGCFLGVSSN